MFDSLDDTLTKILDDPEAPAELSGAAVSFKTPDKNYAPMQATVNLFLYEVKENRELRDPVPIVEKVGDEFIRRKPPLRVDCSYIVTTWSDPNLIEETKVKQEHLLLSQALLWLSRFPTIPNNYLQGSLANQPFPPPTMVAQVDGNKNATGEFWTALGISPRPTFNLVVAIAMDLKQEQTEFPVTTTLVEYLPEKEKRINFGGVVRNASGQPVANAWVRLEPTGLTDTTKEDGSFIFVDVSQGTNYILRARATGLGETSRTTEIPSLSGEYNLQFP
jgi:hypothetical protein